ncbi:MAG TPA: PIN domain-containing protein [Thermoanaerobaculia bacterium]|nr:PIN domain-containing protein [Thermoanaerobaculia bacterium]
MIVADSSALIESYRRGGAPAVRAVVAAAIAADALAINGIIHVEVVGFAADEREQRVLREGFRAFHWLELRKRDFDLAASIGFDLRRRGRTVPATDLIIAATAIHANAELIHVDDHFDEIANVSPLLCRNPAAPARRPPRRGA